MLRPVFIAWLELKRYLADRGDLAFSIALPIVLFALIYAAFGDETSFSGTAHVLDLDGGPVALDLVGNLKEVDGLAVKTHTQDEADRGLDRASILTLVVIPVGFSAGLEAGQPVSLDFKQRGEGGDEGQIVAAIVRGVAQDLAGEYQVRVLVKTSLEGSGVAGDRIEATVGRLVEERRRAPPITVAGRVVGASGDLVDRLLPGIMTMFLMFAVTLGAATLVMERQLGTLERLLTTRLGINQLFLGKFLAGGARAVVQAAILLVLAFVVLRPAGAMAFVEVLAFSVLVAAAVSAIGLVIGALAKTQDQAAWTAVFFTMFMTIFGGTFIDVGDTGPLALLSRLTINHYAIEAMEGVLSGSSGLVDHGTEVAVMVGVAVVGLVVARLAFRVSEGGR